MPASPARLTTRRSPVATTWLHAARRTASSASRPSSGGRAPPRASRRVSALVGPITFGFVAARTSFETAWTAAAVTMVAAALLVVLGRRLLVAHQSARAAAGR